MSGTRRSAQKSSRRRPAWLAIARDLLSGGCGAVRSARERALLGAVLADAHDRAGSDAPLLARVASGADRREIAVALRRFDQWLEATDLTTAGALDACGIDASEWRAFAQAIDEEPQSTAFNNVADWAAVAGDLLEQAVLPARAEAPAAVARGRGAMRTTTRRRTTGSYYTPVEVAQLAANETIKLTIRDGRAISDLLALDPAIGAGVFAMALLDRVVAVTSVADARDWLERGCLCGVDVLPEAIAISRTRLALAVAPEARTCIVPDGTMRLGDALEIGEALRPASRNGSLASTDADFDIVIGNPPFGIRSAHRAAYFGRGQATDSYGLFLALAMRLCRDGGAVGLVTPDTWLTIRRHTQLREHMLEHGQPHAIVLLPLSTFPARVDASLSIWTRDDASESYLVHDHRDGESSALPIELGDHDGARTIAIDAVCAMPHAALPLRDRGLSRLMRYPADLVVRYGDAVEIKQGLATADNRSYVCVAPWTAGTRSGGEPYAIVDPARCLSEAECEKLTDDERENGLNGGRWGDRVFVPYDKGEPSVVRAGWLPMFWTPTRHYLDWSREAVARLRTMTIADRDRARGHNRNGANSARIAARLQNLPYYFRSGLTFSWAGAYSPTFRLHGPHPFDHGSSCVFARDDVGDGGDAASAWTLEEQLAVLNATPTRYLMRVFINHTVNFGIDDLKLVPLVRADRLRETGFDVHAIARAVIDHLQAVHVSGEAADHARLIPMHREIDEAVCHALAFTADERREIEEWFAHRYPALAAAREAVR